MREREECLVAIDDDGRAFGAGPTEDASFWFTDEQRAAEVVQVPVAVARHFLFQKWPGRRVALEILAAEAAPDA